MTNHPNRGTGYKSVDALIAAEKGNRGHVLRSGGHEIAGRNIPVSYRLRDVSGPTQGSRKDVVGWFDGSKIVPIRQA